MSKVLVLNGPNLGRLGVRQPEIYGSLTHVDLTKLCEKVGAELGFQVEVRQTDSESELVGWLHEAAENNIAVIINAAAFTHYSYSIRDAIAQIESAVIEVHISNPSAREEFRHTSVIAGVCIGSISGFGLTSYELALKALDRIRSESN